MRQLYVFLIFINVAISSVAQTLNTSNSVWINTDRGISSNQIRAVAQDRNGFLWIGTNQGLDRFDGEEAIHYYSHHDSMSLVQNSITALEFLNDSILAIGTDGGLSFYNIFSNTWRNVISKTPDSLAPYYNSITVLKKDVSGNLWVASHAGIVVYNQHFQSIRTLSNDSLWRFSDTRVAFAHRIIPLDNGDVILHLFTGIKVFLKSENRVVPLSESSYRDLTFLNELTAGRVFTLWGGFLFCIPSKEDSIVVYDVLHHKKCQTLYFPYNKTPYINWHQFVSTPDSNTVLLSLQQKGYLTFNVNWQNDLPHLEFINRISDSNYDWSSGFRDHQQNLWLLSRNFGICLKNQRKQRFEFRDLVDMHTHQKINSSVNFLLKHADTTWIATYGDGVFLEVKDKILRQIKFSTRTGLPNYQNQVWQLAKVSADTLWVATQLGLYWVEIHDFNYGLVQHRSGQPAVMDSVAITTAFKDRNGNIWMGLGMGKGLVCYNRNENRFRYYKSKRSDGFPGRYPTSIQEDKNGNLWMNSDDFRKLYRWDAKSDKFQTVELPQIFSGQMGIITALCIDTDQTIWLASESWGLLHFNPETKDLRLFDQKQGLYNTSVENLGIDPDGNIWLSTYGGISVFDPINETFTNLTQRSGLPFSFSQCNFIFDTNHQITTGGSGDIIHFDSEIILSSSPPSQPIVTQIKVGLKSIPFPGPYSLNLSSGDKTIALHFSSIDITGRFGITYAYQLRENSPEWIDLGKQQSLILHAPPAGDYVFQVRAKNERGDWSISSIPVYVHVESPFTQTVWFYLILVCTTGLLFYLFYRYRYAQILQMQLVRQRISRDLHDELGSSLTHISLNTLLVKNQVAGNQSSDELLDSIYQSSLAASWSMREIIWNINPQNDQSKSAWPHLIRYASEIVESSGLTLKIDLPETLPNTALSINERRNLILIFKEALQNILKHAHAREVLLELKKDKRWLKISIKDDGDGFETNKHLMRSGLRNMEERAEEFGWKLTIDSVPGMGTTVALSIKIT